MEVMAPEEVLVPEEIPEPEGGIPGLEEGMPGPEGEIMPLKVMAEGNGKR